jgi:hypothetical protein
MISLLRPREPIGRDQVANPASVVDAPMASLFEMMCLGRRGTDHRRSP